jgi:hypothetical protein
MRLNTAVKFTEKTHEGAPAARMTPEQALRRSVLSCLLWEDEFYEDGKTIAERILELSAQVKPEVLAALAVEARSTFNLRHVPLLLLKALVKHGTGRMVADAIFNTIQRADELAEFLAIYWQDGKKPLSNPMRKGLARAFLKFNEYQLSKYNRPGAVKLRDVLFLCHAKPDTDERATIWKKLIDGTLAPPDTWESNLVAGKDKKETFERLIREDKLGYFALLRNLRGMAEAGVDLTLIREAILARKGGAEKILPFRFVAAARACPQLEPELDMSLVANIAAMPPLEGKTVVLVDVSGSMNDRLSAKSDLTRKDAAAALASVVNGDIRMFSFADNVMEIPPRRGMAGIDAIVRSQAGGTRLFDAIGLINEKVKYNRIIVITDEQATDPARFGHWIQGTTRTLPAPLSGAKGYMINVASNKNGVGYGPWKHIDGFSEGFIRFIHETETNDRR